MASEFSQQMINRRRLQPIIVSTDSVDLTNTICVCTEPSNGDQTRWISNSESVRGWIVNRHVNVVVKPSLIDLLVGEQEKLLSWQQIVNIGRKLLHRTIGASATYLRSVYVHTRSVYVKVISTMDQRRILHAENEWPPPGPSVGSV